MKILRGTHVTHVVWTRMDDGCHWKTGTDFPELEEAAISVISKTAKGVGKTTETRGGHGYASMTSERR